MASSISPTYSSSFPALHPVVTVINSSRSCSHQNFSNNSGSSTSLPLTMHCSSLTPPKYPSYLKQTFYGALALKQYRFDQKRHKALVSRGASSSQQQQQQPIAKTSVLEDEQMEQLDLRLPTFWNAKDKSRNIEVGNNGLDLSYIGPGKQETHAALARSNFPMRHQCGIFYFEMRVISKGDDGYIGIGFCCASNKLERLPGWDPDSWGYHGDDGHSFAGSGTGKNYGPCFSTGDIIGCGVNFADHSAFYTKNGKFLGVAFTNMNLNKPVYPAIGLRTPGEQVTANFGHEPFQFDIEQYVRDQKIKFIDEITKSPTLNNNVYSNKVAGAEQQQQEIKTYNSKEVMDQLILSYLIHHGYTGTAKAVVQNAGHVSGQELFLSDTTYNGISEVSEKDMEERQVIRSAIINGKIDESIKLIDQYFPGVLQEEGRGQELQLWLKCGRFIEMMREYCEHNKNRRSRTTHQQENGNGTNQSSSTSDEIASPSSSFNSPIPTMTNRGRRPSYAAIAATLSPSSSADVSTTTKNSDVDMMDIDHVQPTTWTRRASHHNTNTVNGFMNNGTTEQQDGGGGGGGGDKEAADALKLVMQYGQSLQEEYRHDTQEKTRSSLVEIFSLLAYPDPYCSPVAYLMNVSRRDALATEVNAAILAFQNRPEMPAMERIYRQIILSNKELACAGNGKASLINIEDYCARDMETGGSKALYSDPMIL